MKQIALIGALVAVLAAPAAADDKAARLVDDMIEAHGGMSAWRSAGAVYFEDQWIYPGGAKGPVAHFTVEQTQRRAYMDCPELNAIIVWDGEKAWSTNWAMPMPPRFVATLNYYFLNLPWLVKDPGVKLAAEGTRKLWDDDTAYEAVRVTYEAGVGDTPDDYYVLYIHPETKALKACEYIVTYKSLLPEGVKHSPPHVLIYEAFTTVNGLTVPTKYTIYEDEAFYAGCEIKNWSFGKTFDEARMAMPEGAVVDETQP